MSFYPKISYPIGGKLVQGGLPTANQILQFNVLTNQWEFVAAPSGNTFARVVKPVNETIFNNAVFQNDDHLFVDGLVINAEYGFLLLLYVNASVAEGLQIRFNGDGGVSAYTAGALGAVLLDSIPFGAGRSLVTSGQNQMLVILGNARPLLDPSAIQFAWRQNVSGPGPTTVLAGSYLVVWENLP